MTEVNGLLSLLSLQPSSSQHALRLWQLELALSEGLLVNSSSISIYHSIPHQKLLKQWRAFGGCAYDIFPPSVTPVASSSP